MLTQRIDLSLHLPYLHVLRLTALTVAATRHEVQLAVEDAAPRAPNPNQLALLRQFAPSKSAPGPGLNGTDSPSEVL